jgi:hypothetical protein
MAKGRTRPKPGLIGLPPYGLMIPAAPPIPPLTSENSPHSCLKHRRGQSSWRLRTILDGVGYKAGKSDTPC